MMTERPELCELIEAALTAADAAKTKGVLLSSAAVTRCIDVLKWIQGLCLSAKDICNSKTLYRLQCLRNHRNPEIRSQARNLFDLWLRTLYVSGRDDCKKAGPVRLQEINPNPLEASGNLRTSVLMKDENNGERQDTEEEKSMDETELLELFEAAKKSADAANAKGILLGQAEVSRCINALAKLKTFPISRRVLETNHIGERLERLTKHKNQKIRFFASTLLLRWRQSIKNQERPGSAASKKPSDAKTQGGRLVLHLKLRKRLHSSSTASDCVDRAGQTRPLI